MLLASERRKEVHKLATGGQSPEILAEWMSLPAEANEPQDRQNPQTTWDKAAASNPALEAGETQIDTAEYNRSLWVINTFAQIYNYLDAKCLPGQGP